METFWQDLRYALRGMRRRPGFSVFAVLLLGLGIGANTAIFSIVNAVLLRPMPMREPDRIVGVWESRDGSERFPISLPEYLDLKERSRTFEELSAAANWNTNLSGEATPVRVTGMQVTGNFFAALGATAEIGRVLVPEDAKPGATKTVVLGHGFWASHYAEDSGVVGHSIRLNDEMYTVVGVLPPGFQYRGVQDDLIAPLVIEQDPRRLQRSNNYLRAIGRMKAGVSRGQARADLAGILKQLRLEYPNTASLRTDAMVEDLRESLVGKVKNGLLMILGAVATVLLIACGNLAALQLVRASERSREVAIRVSLGATRSRLLRQLLTESMLMALLGGAVGIAVAYAGTKALLRLSPASLPRAAEIGISWEVAAFTLAISVACGLVCGLAPAVEQMRLNLSGSMKEGERGASSGKGKQRLRQGLVAGQIGASLVLLIGTGLLLKSFSRVEEVQPGFNAKNLLVVRLALPRTHYKGKEEVVNFYRTLQPRVASLAGVKSVAVANVVPTDNFLATVDFSIVGRGWSANQLPEAHYRMVTAQYFRTMEIPVIAGRAFEESDTNESAPVVLINQSLAKRYWPTGSPVGEHLQIDDTQDKMREVEVVGVVGDVRDFGLENDAKSEIFTPIAQVPPDTLIYLKNNMYWFVRTANEPLMTAGAFREELGKVDRDVPASATQTMERYLELSVASRRFNLQMAEIFGVAALLLATIGVYGVISYLVTQQTREIGIRMALGAERGEVFASVMRLGLGLAGAGVIAGVVAALILTRWMKSLLFGVSATDVLTYAGTIGLLLVVAVGASLVPGIRATKIDPVIALRYE
jgi:putative ABC transport system permease protein